MQKIVTIGAYGYDASAFFSALQDARVDTFVDLRRRRGVRGATYTFANSRRLQARLAAMDIRYLHRLDLAPTTAVRTRQKAADQKQGVAKRDRETLDEAFVRAFQDEVLASFDSRSFLDDLDLNAQVVALFCVEMRPEACHRSLVAQKLHDDLGVAVMHLLPRLSAN